MRITLEREELISLIGKSLGYVIADEDVTVQGDPFEVHIKNINVADLANTPEQTVSYPEETYEDDTGATDHEKILTMAEILEQNETMGGPKRPLGPDEFLDDPGEPTEAELAATQRQAKNG